MKSLCSFIIKLLFRRIAIPNNILNIFTKLITLIIYLYTLKPDWVLFFFNIILIKRNQHQSLLSLFYTCVTQHKQGYTDQSSIIKIQFFT